ncbi:uncharacterized protein PAC_13715 [Phialocephala subalpina]|uniref:PQ loop repeat protein n=1 Tax=Phialocephala subalpina TaxID=576137 RepID=A0A1L7XFN0_9HELO|nr:uncharacterized protein PAC_13715 [Phialocephala subalpina]
MAPQTSIPVAANVLGEQCRSLPLDSCCRLTLPSLWCVQLIPQTKTTEGLPGIMMLMWAICAIPFGAYSIAQVRLYSRLMVSILSLEEFQHTNPSSASVLRNLLSHQLGEWPVWKATTIGVIMWAAFGGAEAALILTLRPLYDRGIEFPMIILGVIASILLAIGLLPPYFEIWKRRGRVIGINWIFLTIDWSGAFFSLMALVAQNTFDVLGGVLYIICVFLEAGIFVCHLIWMFRTREIRAQAKAEGKTFDDAAKECEEQDVEFKFSEREIRMPGWRKKKDAGGVICGDVEIGKGALESYGLNPTSREQRPAEKRRKARQQDDEKNQPKLSLNIRASFLRFRGKEQCTSQ